TYGTTPELAEFADPAPQGSGQISVDVLVAGLNPVDVSLATGTFYAGAPPLPSVVGREGVGRTAAGRLIYFDAPIAPFGACAERVLLDAGGGFPVPDGLDPAIAVCLGISGLAAWLAVEWRARVRPGETVLVLGASGVVGLIAVQAARLLGAGRVVAAARNANGLERARAAGADATVRLGEPGDLAAALRSAAGGGVDVVIDPLWGEPAAAAIEALSPGGRMVQLGQAAGPSAVLASATIRGRMLTILGHTNFAAPPDVKAAAFARMAAHALAGELTVEVERLPLGEIGDAWARLQRSANCKLVLLPGM
ncbi:MAG TPA: zinc-binding dehydrogenase, partial [Candidatus Dormibacteraeota bacterium]|nr:zinc-binding dehydrogenase [Candidatus Dormibacteraeota bacterium]